MNSARSYLVFLSHGGDDIYIVEELLMPKVAGAGAAVFLDTGAVNYGDNFRRKILEKLGKCDELLVLLTRSSMQRPWVLAEVGATLIRSKRVVAIRYGPSEAELNELGILSLLGTRKLLEINQFDEYVAQLATRVRDNHV